MKNKRAFIPLLLLSLTLIFACDRQPVTQAISEDGVDIVFSNQGKGDASIVLVHGWTNDNIIWDLQVPVLAEKYRVVAPDLAGHGKSGNNREKWAMSAFGHDIAAVVEAAKLDNVILVGFSLGGPAILEAAKLIPEQLTGLILVDAINNPENKIPEQIIPGIDSTYMDLIENPTEEKLVAFGFFEQIPEGAFEKVGAMLDRDQTGWEDILLENFRWTNEDCIGALQAVQVPLIAINTAHQPTAVEVFKKYVPDFEAKILTGTGHVMMWEITDEFNQTLEESIQEILSSK